MLLAGVKSARPPVTEVALSDFLTAANTGALRQVDIEPDRFVGVKADGSRVQTGAPIGYAAAHPTFVPDLIARGIRVEVRAGGAGAMFSASALVVTLAFFALLGFALYRLSPGRMPSVEQDARRAVKDGTSVTFADVAGVDEAKDELREIVEFLREPARFGAIGGRIPKGVLLVGSPGTGKTLLARSIAGEAGVPFLFASGSDFVEMFAGVGASRVRKLFKEARKHPASIIFIDELDAVGRSRGSQSLSHEEREQTLNQLLVEMDGFAPNQGLVVIAATNRPDILDKALLRPGRFDRQVTVANPDVRGREAILAIHSRKVPTGPDVDLHAVARGTPGFSGADLANLVNEAALLAARAGRGAIDANDLEQARDKVLMGAERKSLVMTADERKTTAYHEAGHAVVAARPAARRSDSQGHDHPARPRAGRDDAAARVRPAHALEGVPRGAAGDSDGRPCRRGNLHRPHHQRRRQRHRARHRDRAPHGVRVRDVVVWPGGVPPARPVGRGSRRRLQRSHRAPRRRRDSGPGDEGLRDRPPGGGPPPYRRGRAGRGTARGRVARRRRRARDHRGQRPSEGRRAHQGSNLRNFQSANLQSAIVRNPQFVNRQSPSSPPPASPPTR